jgi:hypothetical protein
VDVLGIGNLGMAFGSVQVEQGPVLYLALEDNKRRMQSRLKQLLGRERPPEDLVALAFECPSLDDGGLEAIEDWLDRQPSARMVIIDVFTEVQPKSAYSDTSYEADYKALTPFKRLADERGLAVLITITFEKCPRTIRSTPYLERPALRRQRTPF